MTVLTPRSTLSVLVALLVGLAASLATVLVAAPAGAADAGPRLTVARAELRAALTCSPGLRSTRRSPVLLVHGTTLTAATNFDWNYQPALEQRGRAWCAVDLPRSGMDDAAVASQYVTFALRRMARVSGRPIDVVGYSQGGMLPRWTLKYWPGTRRLVDDVIGIDPSNHGTLDSEVTCQLTCPPAFWQQATGSRFLAALNDGPETFRGIDYTVVYTLTDQVVVPNLPPAASSELAGPGRRVSNVPVQRICPAHVADHVSMGTTDPVGWAVVRDALSHDGPARAARVSRQVCLRDVMPGVDRAELPAQVARVSAQTVRAVGTSPQTLREPRLPAYAR